MRSLVNTGRWVAVVPIAVALLAVPVGVAAQQGETRASESGAAADLPPMPEDMPITVVDQRRGDGEQCLVCQRRIVNMPMVELRYQGRTFHVKRQMLEEFLSNPDYYFSRLQARSALFDERSVMDREGATNGWLFLGLYVLLGLICSAITGYLAISRALQPVRWFFLGLFGNVFAVGALLAAGRGNAEALPAGIPVGLAKVPTTREPLICANCGGENHPAAKACSHCGTELDPKITAEVDLLQQA